MPSYEATTAKPTIVLVHGLWLTPRSWEGWVARYEQAGYRVLAPSWPGLEGEVEAIRRDPTPLRGLAITTIVDHYERIIRAIAGPVILMGHSFGGLIVQLLVDRGLGDAAVPIASAQPAGVPVLPFVTVRAAFHVLGNPLTYNAATPISAKQFNYAFTNELASSASQAVYDRYSIPGAAHVLWTAALALLNPNASTKVNFKRSDRAPMLFIAGTKDHLSPPAIVRAIVGRYARSTAVTQYHEYVGRTHHTVGQDGWEEVADYALSWALAHARAQRANLPNVVPHPIGVPSTA